MSNEIVNPELMKMSKQALAGYLDQVKLAQVAQKTAFVPGGDQGMDPAAAGGAPPMDPMAAGGAPPMDPMAMGGAPGMDPMAMGGGAPPPPPPPAPAPAAPGVEPIKPKIDVNVEIMKMNKMIARIADSLGVQIPAAEMVGTSEDLTQMAQGQETAGAPPPEQSAIQPVDPMQAAMPQKAGAALDRGAQRAAAMRKVLQSRRSGYAT